MMSVRNGVFNVVVWLIMSLLTDGKLFNMDSCTNLEAQSTLPAQNPENSPYFIQVSTQTYSAGDEILVTLEAATNQGRRLEEFICQAREDTNGASLIPVGNFSAENIGLDSDLILYNCPSGLPANTIATNNNTIRTLPITLVYRAPAPTVGNIQFVCSIVQRTGVFYENLTSQVVVDETNLQNNPPVLAGCPTSDASPDYITPTCVDQEDGLLNTTCLPANGTVEGRTPVICSCTDSEGLTDNCLFQVLVVFCAILPTRACLSENDTELGIGALCTQPVNSSGFTIDIAARSIRDSSVVNFTIGIPTQEVFFTASIPLTDLSGTYEATYTVIPPTDIDPSSSPCVSAKPGLMFNFTVSNPPKLGPCPTNVRICFCCCDTRLLYRMTCSDPEDGRIKFGQGLTCDPPPKTQTEELPDVISCTCTDSHGLADSITCPGGQPGGRVTEN